MPAETLIGFTLLFNRKKKREWYLAAIAGAFVGYALIAFIVQTSLEPTLVEFIKSHDSSGKFVEILNKPRNYGYINIAIGALTIIPANFCLVGGMLINLNPYLVFLIVCCAKVVRVLSVVELILFLWKSALFLKSKIKNQNEEDLEGKAL